MIADVMDESLLLIRQVDSEECDSAEIGNYVQSFADRIQMLILQRAILTTTGYTKLVMDLLLEGKLKFFACGAARQLLGWRVVLRHLEVPNNRTCRVLS